MVVSAESPSINGLATPASTGVMSPIPSEESHGVSSGTGMRRSSRKTTRSGQTSSVT